MRISRKLAAVAAFFVIGAVVAGCGSSIPGNSVASVAGNPITKQAFYHWLYVAAKEETAEYAEEGESVPVIVPDPPKYKQCIAQIRAGVAELATAPASTLRVDCANQFTEDTTTVMNFLIEGYWFQAEAYKLGIKAPDVAKQLKKEYPTKADLESALAASGMTKQDMLFDNRAEALYTKMVKRYEKKVTKSAIAAYYAAHKSDFGTAASRDLHLVRTKSQAQAQAAANALRAGQSWDAVVKKYSADASGKVNGGLLTDVTSSTEEVAVSKRIFASPLNKVVGPIKGVLGSYVIEVTKITPATQESLAKATASIKTDLSQTYESAAAKKVTAKAKKSWFKRTTCRSPYESTYCSNYVKQKTLTAPTTATTTTSSATTTTSSATTSSATGTSSTSTKTATTGG